MTATALRLFEAYGVELEYMIVDVRTLSVRPITDRLLYAVAGEFVSEVELDEIAWSNELALHVVELKTNGPAESLESLPAVFQEHIRKINDLLRPMDARLLPTAMHPWMDPHRELALWPHEYNAVYETFHRIFDCRGHGWANLQSVHLNLPFGDDEEFGRLHAAIRLLMPLMPGLAASSPVVERRVTGLLDNRLDAYRNNSRRVASVSGLVIPEPAFTKDDYDRDILQPMYRDMASLDPQGVLRHEWLNARGAIARFERNSIEVRVLDVQEHPGADVAVCAAITAVLKALVDERWTSAAAQQSISTEPLAKILSDTIRDADQTVIDDADFLAQFGVSESPTTVRDVWQRLIDELIASTSPWTPALEAILSAGPLSRRIVRALAHDVPGRLEAVYRELADCLAEGRTFDAASMA